MMTKWIATLFILSFVSACGDDSATGNNNQNDTPGICGNGVVDLGEQCDDGELNSDSQADACRNDCRQAYCGDRVVDAGETCDDGPSNSDFLAGACRSDCQPFHCGDGVIDPGEECDDANTSGGDGCSDQCLVEAHWHCAGAPSLCTCQDYRLGEGCAQCRVLVDQGAVGSVADGLSWETALGTVQEGIDAGYGAGPGCEVWVAAGTYRVFQTSLFNTVELRSGVGVYGGFAGGETERSQRDWQAHETVLDGEHPTDSQWAVMHVVTAEDTVDATLDGFVVQNGFAQGPRAEDNLGAGLLAFGAVMTIERCRVTLNIATGSGGGLYAYGSDLVIRDSSFVANYAYGDGAGLLVGLSNLELDRSEIRDNQVISPASGNGGGLNSQASDVHAINTLFVTNRARGDGGGIYNIYSTVSLVHCTVSDNSTVGGVGDSFYKGAGSSVEIISSLIVGDYHLTTSTDITASYSLMPTSWTGGGPGTLATTPTFVGGGDYHLHNTSAGIDRADGLAAPPGDLEGTPRYDVNTVNDVYVCAGQPGCVSYADCGAYEYHP